MVTVKKGKGVGISIQTGEIDDSAVTTQKIADDAVTTLKIADANVTTLKIADDAIDGNKLADNAVDINHLNATGEAAGYSLKVNATNDGLEFGLAEADPDGNLTIGGVTKTLREWIVISL